MINLSTGTELLTIKDFRIRRWFKNIADAETDGWRIVSVKIVPGWFVDYYTAHLHRNSGLEVDFTLGPIKDRK